MRSKFLGGAAALALTAAMVAASSAPASAQRWHGSGFWPADVAAGIVGGAVAAATSPLWAPGYYGYNPGYSYRPYGYNTYDYAPGPVVAQGGNTSYCEARFRSYDPASGTYLGFDGQRHPCP
jgi:hypothetical protein